MGERRELHLPTHSFPTRRASDLEKAKKVQKKHGRDSKQGIAELKDLAELFMPIKLVPKQFDALVVRVRDSLERLRAQERAIMQLCVRDARKIGRAHV